MCVCVCVCVHSSTHQLISHTRNLSINTRGGGVIQQQVVGIHSGCVLINIRRDGTSGEETSTSLLAFLPFDALRINRMASHIWLTAPISTHEINVCGRGLLFYCSTDSPRLWTRLDIFPTVCGETFASFDIKVQQLISGTGLHLCSSHHVCPI